MASASLYIGLRGEEALMLPGLNLASARTSAGPWSVWVQLSRMSPEKGHEDAPRTKAPLLWRHAEGAGLVLREGEEKSLERP